MGARVEPPDPAAVHEGGGLVADHALRARHLIDPYCPSECNTLLPLPPHFTGNHRHIDAAVHPQELPLSNSVADRPIADVSGEIESGPRRRARNGSHAPTLVDGELGGAGRTSAGDGGAAGRACGQRGARNGTPAGRRRPRRESGTPGTPSGLCNEIRRPRRAPAKTTEKGEQTLPPGGRSALRSYLSVANAL